MRNPTKEELEEWGIVADGDIYSEDVVEELLDNDELSAEEEAFIRGYESRTEEAEE